MKKIIILSLSNLLLLICACTNEVLTQSTECFRVMGFLDDVSRTTFIDNGNITDTHWVKNDSIGLYTTTEQNILYTALNSGKNTEFTSL